MIRKFKYEDIPAISKVKIASWRSTYRGLIPNHILDQLSQEQDREQLIKLLKTNKDMVGYVVEAAPGEIVGYVLGGPERTAILYIKVKFTLFIYYQNTSAVALGR